MPTDDSPPLRPTPAYRDALRRAEQVARRHGHPYVGAEHLLLGLLEDGHGAATAVAGLVDLPVVRTELERVLAADPATSTPDGTERTGAVHVALVRGEERQQAQIHWWWTGLGPNDAYRAELEWSGPAVEVSGSDMFDVLVRIREQTEPRDWFVAVQGSRLDTYPSGMQRDMGGGLSVYVVRPGEPTRLTDVVETFAEAAPEMLATVADQRAHAEAWVRSLQAAP